MKTKVILMVFSIAMMLCMNACSGNMEKVHDNQDSQVVISVSENIEAESTKKAALSEDSETYPAEEADNQITEGNSSDETSIGESTMIMKIGETKVNVDWEDNQAVDALKDMAENGDITIQMSMYGGFEQVGSIGKSLPRDDKQTTTSSGDIVLYSGNQMVVFYGSNSWSYTRLGHITDKSSDEMKELLGNGDVTITVQMID